MACVSVDDYPLQEWEEPDYNPEYTRELEDIEEDRRYDEERDERMMWGR